MDREIEPILLWSCLLHYNLLLSDEAWRWSPCLIILVFYYKTSVYSALITFTILTIEFL